MPGTFEHCGRHWMTGNLEVQPRPPSSRWPACDSNLRWLPRHRRHPDKLLAMGSDNARWRSCHLRVPSASVNKISRRKSTLNAFHQFTTALLNNTDIISTLRKMPRVAQNPRGNNGRVASGSLAASPFKSPVKLVLLAAKPFKC